MKYVKQLLGRYISGSYELDDLCDQLTSKSCEVEHKTTRIIPEEVVLGKVVACEKHPDADKLTVCQVDCGPKGNLQICTGASNIRNNIYVAVATPGCYLPAIDLQIDPRTMRGLASNGMICSKEELGIAEDLGLHGIWIMQDAPATDTDTDFYEITDAHLGTPLAHFAPWLVGRTIDIENKTITHRPDLFGHFGVAREVQALFPDNIRFSRLMQIAEQIAPHQLMHTLTHAHPCDRDIHITSPYVGAYSIVQLNDITVHKSSLHQRLQLIDCGVTPKNNWIDFSNYFMFLTGQPIHCFDAASIQGPISVRQAENGEKFIDLFHQEHLLTEQDIVICDDKGILALAGVVGGARSGIQVTTTSILIEIAQFDPVIVRKTAMRLGIRTEAQIRFEKHINPRFSLACVLCCLDEIQYLGTQELGTASFAGLKYWLADRAKPYGIRTIPFVPEQIRRLTGISLEDTTMCSSLKLLGIDYDEQNNNLLIPVRRGVDDLHHTADISEEVARLYGFDTISPAPYSTSVQALPLNALLQGMRKAEEILTNNLGYTQIETYPRIHSRRHDLFGASTDRCLVMENSIAPEFGLLRHSLVPSILDIIEKNAPFFDTLRVFDSGSRREKREDGTYQEILTIIFAHVGKITTQRQDNIFIQTKQDLVTLLDAFFASKQTLWSPSTFSRAHTAQQTELYIDKNNLGTLATIHPKITNILKLDEDLVCVVASVNLPILLYAQQTHPKEVVQTTLQDQCIRKDISFVAPKSAHYGHISDALLTVTHIDEVTLLDIYTGETVGENEKSISLRFLIKGDGSLTTEQISDIMQQAIQAGQRAGGKLRGEKQS